MLHKLKELYVNDKESKIAFTCYNRILAQNMTKRIPDFFDFMKVEEQIKWDERMWVIRSWGSGSDKNSGVYSYICSYYNLTFQPYSNVCSFDKVCKDAIKELQDIIKQSQEDFNHCFDYMLIDESQDFPESFFDLCDLVTAKKLYIAGDIFQDIYDRNIGQAVSADFLLNKCYRTDPRTLMFAHAVEMGLYEKPVIRWLYDEEWNACGYKLERKNNRVILYREPLRRFEDLEDYNISNIELITFDDNSCEDSIMKIIDKIKYENDTVEPEDIAIVFLENSNGNYKMADKLEIFIKIQYDWDVVKGYETKSKDDESLFISNRNNIKGLEFPFVICVVRGPIEDDLDIRNSIYMMLTRSFITSYFLIHESSSDLIETFNRAIEDIRTNGAMNLREPSDEEINVQNRILTEKSKEHKKSQREIIDEILDGYHNIQKKHRTKIYRLVYLLLENSTDIDSIRDVIEKNIDSICGGE